MPANLTLPTLRELNNFLKTHRKKKDLGGNLGNQICLNDFIEIYEKHKEVPENFDQMLVVNCFTNIDNVMHRSFRIFFQQRDY